MWNSRKGKVTCKHTSCIWWAFAIGWFCAAWKVVIFILTDALINTSSIFYTYSIPFFTVKLLTSVTAWIDSDAIEANTFCSTIDNFAFSICALFKCTRSITVGIIPASICTSANLPIVLFHAAAIRASLPTFFWTFFLSSCPAQTFFAPVFIYRTCIVFFTSLSALLAVRMFSSKVANAILPVILIFVALCPFATIFRTVWPAVRWIPTVEAFTFPTYWTIFIWPACCAFIAFTNRLPVHFSTVSCVTVYVLACRR